MRRRIFTFTLIGLAAAIIVFIGCQKNKIFDKSSTEEKAQIVPFDTAFSIAVHFNPSSFFNTNDTSNHSPFHSSLTGNNEIKDYATINDSKGVTCHLCI